MSHDTIPKPNDNDIEQATNWVKLAQENPGQAIAVLAQMNSECRWLRNLTHPRSTK